MGSPTKTRESLYLQAQKTVELRTNKAFRRRLVFSRFKSEMLRGNRETRRDFFAFVSGRLNRKNSADARPLLDFDPTKGEEVRIANDIFSVYANCPHKRQAVIFSRYQYYVSGGGQRAAQLSKAFGKLGFDVLYIYAESNYYSMDKDFISGLELHQPYNYYAPERLAGILQPGAIALFEHPFGGFLPYLRTLKKRGVITVFDYIDNWDTELGEDWYDRESYLSFIGEADIITATSRSLREKAESDSGRSVIYNPNGVDTDLFDPKKSYERPNDMPEEAKIILYFGHIMGYWFDWDLVYDTAELCPDCGFLMIGYGTAWIKREKPKNVYFLDIKPQAELPAYLAGSDFAMLHINTKEVGVHVSPIKAFEYLAMHKRVLATPLPEIIGYPNVICSNDPKVWAETIKNPPAEAPYDDFVEANSWHARCREIIQELTGNEQQAHGGFRHPS